MDEMESYIPAIIAHHLGGAQIESIHDRGEIVRHIYEVRLAGGDTVLVKFQPHKDWLDTTLHDLHATRMLREHGLGAPEVLAADKNHLLALYSFVIERKGGGTRLDKLLPGLSETERADVFRAVGQYYGQMNDIPGPRQGVWLDDPEQTFSMTPNEFYLQNELTGGSGMQLVKEGRLSQAAWQQITALWEEALGDLNDQPAVMVHGSAFHWSIYLERGPQGWMVNRISSIGDILWWDAAYNVAMLLYPPFAEIQPSDREALAEGYGPLPEERYIWLFLLLQRLLSANGVFLEPKTPRSEEWKANCLADDSLSVEQILGKLAVPPSL